MTTKIIAKKLEKPMLFNGDMVLAILDGSKTQARRVMKVQPPFEDAQLALCLSTTGARAEIGKYRWVKVKERSIVDSLDIYFPFPFGKVGDQLWVRETYMPDAPRDGTWCDVEYYGCKGSKIDLIPKKYRLPKFCIYSASWSGGDLIGWKPPLHMPRWASRIQLEITGIRVERLNDITDEDAFAEGIVPLHLQDGEQGCWFSANTNNQNLHARTAKQAFQKLWNSTGGDWDENPWVWVIEFKRVEVTA